jgi:hypothetical protein
MSGSRPSRGTLHHRHQAHAVIDQHSNLQALLFISERMGWPCQHMIQQPSHAPRVTAFVVCAQPPTQPRELPDAFGTSPVAPAGDSHMQHSKSCYYYKDTPDGAHKARAGAARQPYLHLYTHSQHGPAPHPAKSLRTSNVRTPQGLALQTPYVMPPAAHSWRSSGVIWHD